MDFSLEPLTLNESTFLLLSKIIQERTGLNYRQDQKDLLVHKLSPRVLELGLSSFLDYYYLLKYDEDAEIEWLALMDTLSVPESFFWREFDQIKALVDVLIPKYLAKYNIPARIWCAATATGEEPLTIAMAVKEAGLYFSDVEINATDASEKVLAHAKKGLYREHSFRNLSEYLKLKYFTQEKLGWRIEPILHQQINWDRVNLLEESEVRKYAAVPFIFCRNVFIYFSEETIKKTVRLFYESMPEEGYLFVSSSESLLKITNDFTLEEIGGALVYVKR